MPSGIDPMVDTASREEDALRWIDFHSSTNDCETSLRNHVIFESIREDFCFSDALGPGPRM